VYGIPPLFSPLPKNESLKTAVYITSPLNLDHGLTPKFFPPPPPLLRVAGNVDGMVKLLPLLPQKVILVSVSVALPTPPIREKS